MSATETSSDPITDTSPYDALLLVSFGGPEGPDDVLPFLENVTRGRGIPRERLLEVGEHYFGFGGVSPINAQNRALVDGRAGRLRDARRWTCRSTGATATGRRTSPTTLARIADDGHDRVLVLLTSAYSSYSGCRQYRENLAAAVAPLGDRAPQVDRIRHYFNHPGFVEAMVTSTVAALADLPADVRPGARLVFVTHSIPTSMDETSGPDGDAYSRQHRDVARLVTAGVAAATGTDHGLDLVYCSRSGPPTQPWLEPDVNDHLESLVADGVPAAVLVPIGFVSDHMEVKYDLDTEARATAERLGLPVARAATVGTDPRVRGGGARAGPGAGRSGARRDAGTPGARRARAEPRRLPRGLLPQRARPRAARPLRRLSRPGRMPA